MKLFNLKEKILLAYIGLTSGIATGYGINSILLYFYTRPYYCLKCKEKYN